MKHSICPWMERSTLSGSDPHLHHPSHVRISEFSLCLYPQGIRGAPSRNGFSGICWLRTKQRILFFSPHAVREQLANTNMMHSILTNQRQLLCFICGRVRRRRGSSRLGSNAVFHRRTGSQKDVGGAAGGVLHHLPASSYSNAHTPDHRCCRVRCVSRKLFFSGLRRSDITSEAQLRLVSPGDPVHPCCSPGLIIAQPFS